LCNFNLHIPGSVTVGVRGSTVAARATDPVVGTPLMNNEWVDF
jgi:hypothetical protein